QGLAVTFSGPVTLDPGAFVLTPQGGGAAVPLSWTTALVNGVTVATIAFPGTTGGSLDDGNWVLRTVASQVHDAAAALMAADRADTFFRLFGDANGDRRVDTLDLFGLYTTFGKPAADPGFLAYFDFDGSGTVDTLDLFRFYQRFGTTLAP